MASAPSTVPATVAVTVPVYPFSLPALRFAEDALQPYVMADVVRQHRAEHQQYVARLNQLLADLPTLHGLSIEAILRNLAAVPAAHRAQVEFEGGGHANHQFFWKIIGRGLGQTEGVSPSAQLAEAITAQFGSLAQFQAAFTHSALQLAGPGWTFLVIDQAPHGPLQIVSLPDNGSVLSRGQAGILCCDLWQHAYQTQYGVSRQAWLEAYWAIVAWDVASRRYDGIRQGLSLL